MTFKVGQLYRRAPPSAPSFDPELKAAWKVAEGLMEVTEMADESPRFRYVSPQGTFVGRQFGTDLRSVTPFERRVIVTEVMEGEEE